ncbi:MAG TPA: M56 family metallopeptidase [Allosphingosinicella sp.]|jgi:beta-lactamase regulating signal transducer with metallopeptidase domain|nr:M56 family metallopeptidase [Allosphingosinicella sp.]
MSYDFLIEMGWKSAAIAGGALLLAAMLRSRAAADRGAVLKVAVALLLALPAIALFAPALEVETAAEPRAATAAPSAYVPPAAIDAVSSPSLPLSAAPELGAATAPSVAGDWDDPSLLFFLLYLGGVAMVAGRLFAGMWTLRRWTRGAAEVEAPEWRSALARAGGDPLGIRLLACEEASSPLSWGLRRPVILLDPDTLRSPEEADAILAHEVAHVARRDWPSLILSRLAVALFWFNPLVWRLDREVSQQAEEAADSDAAATVEPARYAQTLLDWARLSGGSALPANAIAAGEPGLSRRVKAILDGRVSRRSGSGWAVAAMLGCAAFAAPVAALDFVPAAPEAPTAPVAPLAAPAPLAPPAPSAPAAARLAGAPAAPAPMVPPAPGAAPAPLAPLAAAPGRPALAPLPPLALAAAMQARAPRPPRPPRSPYVDGDAIEAEVERAVAEAMRSVDMSAVASRASGEAAAAVVAAMKHGAVGMEAGARSMEEAAQRMRSEAAKLKSSKAYREDVIRRSAARGERVTHEQLLEAADEMEEGVDDMREGAREMREAAAEMRRGKRD